MDSVCDELERPAGQTLSVGFGEFCGGIQQQGRLFSQDKNGNLSEAMLMLVVLRSNEA